MGVGVHTVEVSMWVQLGSLCAREMSLVKAECCKQVTCACMCLCPCGRGGAHSGGEYVGIAWELMCKGDVIGDMEGSLCARKMCHW